MDSYLQCVTGTCTVWAGAAPSPSPPAVRGARPGAAGSALGRAAPPPAPPPALRRPGPVRSGPFRSGTARLCGRACRAALRRQSDRAAGPSAAPAAGGGAGRRCSPRAAGRPFELTPHRHELVEGGRVVQLTDACSYGCGSVRQQPLIFQYEQGCPVSENHSFRAVNVL